MFKTRYLIRLDDACPYMDRVKWQRMENILDKYGVKPLVGIIPANADLKTMIDPDDNNFWVKAHSWVKKGWSIALHGYDHVCISDDGMKGLNPFWRRSEFAGLSLELQREKIRNGYAVLKEQGFEPKYFFAPDSKPEYLFYSSTLTSGYYFALPLSFNDGKSVITQIAGAYWTKDNDWNNYNSTLNII